MVLYCGGAVSCPIGYIFKCAGGAQTSSAGSVSISPAGRNSYRNLGITDVHAAKKETSQLKGI